VPPTPLTSLPGSSSWWAGAPTSGGKRIRPVPARGGSAEPPPCALAGVSGPRFGLGARLGSDVLLRGGTGQGAGRPGVELLPWEGCGQGVTFCTVRRLTARLPAGTSSGRCPTTYTWTAALRLSRCLRVRDRLAMPPQARGRSGRHGSCPARHPTGPFVRRRPTAGRRGATLQPLGGTKNRRRRAERA